MYTLAYAHFAKYENIPNPGDLDPSELPGGALILAMQADNYGDTIKWKAGSDGRIKDMRVLNAGKYKPTIRNLSIEKHWAPIFKAVTCILNSTRKKKKAHSKSPLSHTSLEMLIDETPEYILVSDDSED